MPFPPFIGKNQFDNFKNDKNSRGRRRLLVVALLAGLGLVVLRPIWRGAARLGTSPVKYRHDRQRVNILIVYSSGVFGAIVPELDDRSADAVTSATPKHINTRFVAERIASMLPHHEVSVKRVDEIKKPMEILANELILFGSSTHFSNMDWQMKYFFDVTMYPIYVHRAEKLKHRTVACFTTANVNSSGKKCVDAMNTTLYDYGATILQGLIITDDTAFGEAEKKIQAFVSTIEKSL